MHLLARCGAGDAGEIENGKVKVTCEFCSTVYEFTPEEAGIE
jgi:molecular chaperone Hsp33